MADCIIKGRFKKPPSGRRGKILSQKEKAAIRTEHASGDAFETIRKRHGIHWTTARNVVFGLKNHAA